MKGIIILISLFLIFNNCLAFSEEHKIKITGIYSNLSYSQGPGDIAGTEIFILQGGDNNEYYLIFQEAEGWPKPPLLIKPIINKYHIEFVVPQKSYTENGQEFIQTTNYTGTIKKNGIELEGQNRQTKYKWKEFLKRKNSYWQ